MARRNPLAAKMHAANVRERKKRDALREVTFEPLPRPKVCALPEGEKYGIERLGANPLARDRACRKLKGAAALRIEMDRRARLYKRDPSAWASRVTMLALSEVRIGLR